MEFDPKTLKASEIYKLTTGIIVPRPVAWVTSLGASGTINLAPFSAFNYVCQSPPMVMFSIVERAGALKDTTRNILDKKEFVVNIANMALLEALHDSSADYAEGESEVDILGLEIVASTHIATPRLAAAPASMECELSFTKSLGTRNTMMIVGEVKSYHVRDDLVNDGKVNTVDLNPVARLGGPNYASLGEVITLPPAVPKTS